jgi:hypothetical protein
MKKKWGYLGCSLALLLLITGVLLGCGGHSTPTQFLAVTDSPSRVLIYSAPFSTNQAAGVVLGQPNFTTIASGSPLTQAGIAFPSAVAADASGNLFVADIGLCRVSQFKPPFSNGMNATLVLGQPDFTTPPVCNASGTSVGAPSAVKVDGRGNVWVSDIANSRIVQFNPPLSNGMAASLVIGQPNLTSSGCNQGGTPTASTLCVGLPSGLAFDSAGNLWVADTINNRVLQFRSPFSNGMAATVVLGQPNFTSMIPSMPPNAASMLLPARLAFDSAGYLWVADMQNNRVLQFRPPFSNGMSAAQVLGQADFAHNLPLQGGTSPTASTLVTPMGITTF